MPESTFSPVVIPDCDAPNQEVFKVSLAKDISEKLLEARLRGVYYLVSVGGQTMRELTPSEVSSIEDESYLLQEDLVIEQRYSIVVDLAPRYTYHFSLILSPDGRELYCRLAQGSKIDKDEKSIKQFFERIRIHKADMHILIRDERTEYERLKIFIQSLPDEKFLSKPHEFLLAQSVGGLPCIEPHLEIAINLKGDNSPYRLVLKDQLIATFFKGQSGEAARDCLGRFIAPQEPKQQNVMPFNVDESINAQENDSCIKYFAKHAGYIALDRNHNKLGVMQKISIKNASVTTSGNLLGGLNTGTHVVISSTDLLEDSIGEGTVIEAGTVEVIGNVGNKALIRANNVIIKGQTHQNSQIFADNINITIHKGHAEGDQVKIARLEAGEVRGEHISIDEAYGGRSFGQDIRISTLHSNHHAHSAGSIMVNNLKGEDNKFILCANASPKKNSPYQVFISGRKQFTQQLLEKQREYHSMMAELQGLQPLVRQIKDDIKKFPKDSSQLKLIQEQAHNYRNLLHYTAQLKDEIDALEQKLERIRQEITKLEESMGSAYVLIKSGWKGYNEVKYKKLSEDEREIFLNPKPGHDGPRIQLDDSMNLLISMRG